MLSYRRDALILYNVFIKMLGSQGPRSRVAGGGGGARASNIFKVLKN